MTFSQEDTLFIHQNYVCMKENAQLWRRERMRPMPDWKPPADFSVPVVACFMLRAMEVQAEICIAMLDELRKGACPPWVHYNYLLSGALRHRFISKEEYEKIGINRASLLAGPWLDIVSTHIYYACHDQDMAIGELLKALKL